MTGIFSLKKTMIVIMDSTVKENLWFDSKMAYSIRASGWEICVMASENKNGLMVHSMKGNGSTTKLMVKASLYTPMEIIMKESGKMTKLMATASMFITKLELNIKDTGSRICNMGLE
jgi:hypothetical protein